MAQTTTMLLNGLYSDDSNTLTPTTSRDAALDLFVDGSIDGFGKVEFSAHCHALDSLKAASSSIVKINSKGGLFVKAASMVGPVTVDKYLANDADPKKQARPTYSANVNVADGCWQPMFTVTDADAIVAAIRDAGGNGLLADIVAFASAHPNATRTADDIGNDVLAAVEASRIDDETDAEYANRVSGE